MRISNWSADVCSSDLHRSLSLRDSEALQAEGADGVAAQELPDLLVGEAGLGADVVGHLLRVREGAVDVGVVGLEADLVHADEVAVPQAGLVVDDAAVDPSIGRATCRGRVCQYVLVLV